MTHTPTKNSETYLKPCPFCGSDARTDAGMGHARCSKTACELGKIGAPWFTIEEWNTRAPVDLDSQFTEVTGTYPERGEGQVDGKPFPELDQVINHIAPMLSGEKETGIDWMDDRGISPDQLDAVIAACELEMDRFDRDLFKSHDGKFIEYLDLCYILPEVVRYALSRQSAVGGDWEKELEGVKDAYALVAQHIKWSGKAQQHDTLFFAALNDLRRALRCATRTPEGEGIRQALIDEFGKTADKVFGMEATMYRGSDVIEKIDRVLSTPPPRPTATGGITEEMRYHLAMLESITAEANHATAKYGEWPCDHSEGMNYHRAKLHALIERAGEEDHE